MTPARLLILELDGVVFTPDGSARAEVKTAAGQWRRTGGRVAAIGPLPDSLRVTRVGGQVVPLGISGEWLCHQGGVDAVSACSHNPDAVLGCWCRPPAVMAVANILMLLERLDTMAGVARTYAPATTLLVGSDAMAECARRCDAEHMTVDQFLTRPKETQQ